MGRRQCLVCEVVNEAVIAAVGEIVKVLDTDDFGKGLSLGELLWRHGAEANVANEPLPLEFNEHLQWFRDGAGLWSGKTAHPEIDDIEGIEAEIAQIVLDALDQIFSRTVENPGAIVATASADLGDEGEVFRVRMQGFLNELVRYVRTVEVAGVNVVDAGIDGLVQNGDGFGAITGWAENVGTGELHGAVADAVNGECGSREVECTAEFALFRHVCVSDCECSL